MQRRQVVIGVLGMVLAASAAHAAAPSEVTLFGQKYKVEVHKRDGSYKNGVKITLPSDGNNKANLFFVEGADPSADRLFVAATIRQDDSITGDQFYLLTGADANGIFNPTNSAAREFFGGNVTFAKGGRPVSVAWLNDTNTGVKKDRNIVIKTFANEDRMSFYDLDTLDSGFESDALLAIYEPSETAINPNPDPGMPWGDFGDIAPGPNGAIVVIGINQDGDAPEIGVMDPAKDKFFNVKTNLVEATKSAAIQIDPADGPPHAFVRMSENEYWMLNSDDQQGDDDNVSYQNLYRLRLTFPADFASAAPNSIKAEVLGKEDMMNTNLGASPGGIYGMAVGRAVTANGARRLYMADWQGNLITLTPE